MFDLSFDKDKRYQYPTLFLLNPDETRLCAISSIKGLIAEYCFNDLSTLTFDVYEYDTKGKNPSFDLIQVKRKIDMGENWGKWIITDVSRSSDGGIFKNKSIASGKDFEDFVYKKTVTCASLQADFLNKTVYVDGTIQFYTTTDNTGLLNQVVATLPEWTIGYVSSSLRSKYRTFTEESTTAYNIMCETMSKSYECIFVFDFYNKIVNAYTASEIINNTDIYLSYRNLVNEIQIDSSDSNGIFTAIEVSGADGVGISNVNPLGNNVLYNFDYYLDTNSELMDSDLIAAINTWNAKINSYQSSYSDLLLSLKTANIELLALNTELTELNTTLAALEQSRWAKIESNQSISSITAQINSQTFLINSKKSEITTKQNQIIYLKSQITNIVNELKIENNFTTSQYNKLSNYITQGSYSDDTFVYTDGMNDVEKQEISQNLYDKAKDELTRLSQPTYTFSLQAINFILLEEYKVFTEQLELGCSLSVQVKDGEVVKPILLKMSIDFDEPQNCEFTFSNTYKLKGNGWQFEELFNQSNSTANRVSIKGSSWGYAKDAYDDFNAYIDNALDLAKQSITTSSAQEFTMSDIGIRGKKTNSNEEIWINNNLMVFTKDAWNSAETAIGKVSLPNGNQGYGILAKNIIGELVASNQLYIKNSAGTFEVNENGMVATNFNLTLTSGSNSLNFSPTTGILAKSGNTEKLKFSITTGELEISGRIIAETGLVGGFTITNSKLYAQRLSGNFIGMTTDGVKAFYAGATDSSGSNAQCYITYDGNLYCNNGNFKGTIYAEKLGDLVKSSQIENLQVTKLIATSGKISELSAISAKIGGFTITSTRLYSKLVENTPTYIGLKTDGTKAFFAGATDEAGNNASYYVTHDGALYATSATIKGSITSGSTISGAIINGGSLNIGKVSISQSSIGKITYEGYQSVGITMDTGNISMYSTSTTTVSATNDVKIQALFGSVGILGNLEWNGRGVTTASISGKTCLVLM